MATCAQCGREFQPVADGQMFCAQCQPGQNQTFGQAPKPRSSRVPTSFYLHSPSTWLIVINTVIFLVTCVYSRSINEINLETLMRFGAAFGPLTLGGQPWRLLTSTFLHGNFLHLAFNMWALLNLGILAEVLFGRRAYTLMYFVCGLTASLISTWWHFHTGNIGVIGVGASGAIFGIAGALIPALALQKNARLRAALTGNLTSISIFVIYTVVFGFREAHIDNSAHLGGLAAGLLLGLVLPSSPGPNDEQHFGRRMAVFAVSAVVMLAGFAWLQKSHIAVLEFALGQSAYQKKDINGAVAHLNSSLQHNPQFADSHYLLGNIYLEQQKNDEAIQQFLETTKFAPRSANAHSQLCVAYLRSRDLANALASCKQAVELDPNDADQRFNLGLTQRANEDLEGAIDSFTKAEQFRPNGFDEEAMLGESLVDAGRVDEAIVHLRLANKAKPDNQHVRMLLARLLLRRGDREEAQKLLGK
jgi:membrane associated rhomboid family serine protease/Flp pilus assembly protein TadD